MTKTTERMKTLPQARPSTDFVVERLADEVLVYDLDARRAHCLNPTAAILWRACDGQRSLPDLARLLQDRSGLPADEEVVRLALRDLHRAGLLRSSAEELENSPSRRAILRRLTVSGTAALLPALVSASVGPQDALASCVPARLCVPGLTECTPCHEGNKDQCKHKVCRGGNCVDLSATDCGSGDAARAARSRRAPRKRR